MSNPAELRPATTREGLTAKAAKAFAKLATSIGARIPEPHRVAHFLNKVLFCLFAEDADLLPAGLIRRLADTTRNDPDGFAAGLADLFAKMSYNGGLFGSERIQWFNGGLFDGADVLPLTREEIEVVRRVSDLDWSEIEPAIFGTLFERGLDPDKRSQLGAHYTDRTSIQRLVDPVVVEPLRRVFEATKTEVTALLERPAKGSQRTRSRSKARHIFEAFLTRLRSFRVLDPACGSGNFLYLALQALKELEHEALQWESTSLQEAARFPDIGPEAVLGIEVNAYAAELARVTIWIGEIQWMIQNGFHYRKNPVLRPLENIRCADAILDLSDPSNPGEPDWPEADVIVSNPPYLGGKLLRKGLGDDYVQALFRVYDGRIPREADLVTYWFEKARAMVEAGQVKRVGLLATQGIRGGANRRVLERIKDTGDIFLAFADQEWVLEGAAVHVSFIAFDDGSETHRTLDGRPVEAIHANLTSGLDITQARRLRPNLGIAFMGDTKGGSFDITEDAARKMLASPNPDRRNNADVVRRWANGLDITRRSRNMWIIDFGSDLSEREAALYEAPFEHVRKNVRPVRAMNRRAAYATRWWIHVEPRPAMRAAFIGLQRYIATPTVSKHRLFVWLPVDVLPDHQLIAFARDDDYTFGVLHSRVHEVWARAKGTQLREVESGFRYTPTSTFETFPFPT